MSTKLAQQTQKTAGIGNGMRTATIAAVSPLTLSVNGGQFSSGVGVLSTYVPVVGDVVAVFRQDSSWLVLGAIGASLGPQPRGSLTGTELVSFTAASSFLQPVSFSLVFPAAPVVTTDINSQLGVTNPWITEATVVTPTGFTIWCRSGGVAATWSNVPVDWVATARA